MYAFCLAPLFVSLTSTLSEINSKPGWVLAVIASACYNSYEFPVIVSILFSLASCVISRSLPQAAGQPYILATFPPISYSSCSPKSAEIYLSIKELNALVKAKVITTEAGDDIEKSSELGPMRTITVRIANSNKLCSPIYRADGNQRTNKRRNQNRQ